MIDVILRQGKQLITMNFIHFIRALPILGGGVCVKTFAWMVLGKLVYNFPKGDATKKMAKSKTIFLREKYIPFKYFFNGICWS